MGGQTEDPYCFSCNATTTALDCHSIFHTFLSGSDLLLVEVLERYLLLPEVGSLQTLDPVLCTKCCARFEELAVCEKKVHKLRQEIWRLYKTAIIDRNSEVTNFIRGIAVQTDLTFEEERNDVDHDQMDYSMDVPVKVVFDNHSDNEAIDHGEAVGSPGEQKEIVDIQQEITEDQSRWWKRRGTSCKFCGKWFKTNEELEDHSKCHGSEEQAESQEKEESPIDGKSWRRCTKCDMLFSKIGEYRTHIKTHKETEPKLPKRPVVYKCKLCEKKFKSKAGAMYHAKTHNFDVKKNFNLKEAYRIIIGGKEEEELDGPSTLIIVQSEHEQSSSDDELPLAKRRKQFIFEKIKQNVQTDPDDANVNTSPKKALLALKQCTELQVTKLTKSVEAMVEDQQPLQTIETEQILEKKHVVQEIELNNSDDFVANAEQLGNVTIDMIKEEINSDEISGGFAAPRQRGRPRTKKLPPQPAKEEKESEFVLPPVKPARFKCEICGKMWKTRGELNAHRGTHSNARPYICEICGQAYKHKAALDVHVSMHRGIYQHQCPFCKKAFTQKGALQRHLPIHTGDLPFQCELCGKRFVHRTSFSIHSMAHTGIRTIRCEVCNMGVLSKSHLRRHMRIHSGEKPYECQTCGKAFAERYNLVAHQRIHDPNQAGPAKTHKRKPQCCRICNAVFDKRQLEDHMVTAHNKILEDPQRATAMIASAYDNVDAFITHRFDDSSVIVTKNEVSDVSKREEPSPSVDLSMRGVHGNIRNIDIIRNSFEPRNLDLLRLANGVVETPSTWGYMNSTS